uniref:Uncharacterized protein n=1 Tax=Arundo donax TaxID=35708 RepID=A0A0A9FG88_ARUDO
MYYALLFSFSTSIFVCIRIVNHQHSLSDKKMYVKYWTKTV